MGKVRKFLASLSVAALLTSILGVGVIAQAATFSDVSEDHWAYSFVEEGYENGWWEGSGGVFGCDSATDRATFAAMVYRAYGFEDTGYSAGFTDMVDGAWYVEEINTLAQHGIMTGDTNADGDLLGTVRPGDAVNRAEAAKMIALAGGLDLVEATGEVFSDVMASDWFGAYAETLYWNTIVDGYDDGSYGPADNLTKCQLAKMVVNGQSPVTRDMEEEEEETTEEEEEEEEETTEEEEEVESSTGSLDVEAGDAVTGGTVPKGANHVEMLNVNFTASTEDVTVTGLEFVRGGVGATSDISNVYLYDGTDRLTTGRTVSSDDQMVTFSSLNWMVGAGETETLTLVIDFSATASASNTHYFSLQSAEAVTHNGVSTEGDFPITGSTFELGSQSAGTLTVNKYGSLANATVGEQDAELAKFKFTGATEDLWVQQISLRVRGTVSNSLLTNFTLWNGSTEVATATGVNSSDLIVLVFTTPLEIETGDNEQFTLTGDIGAVDANDVVVIDIDENADVVAIGEVYGYGARVDTDDADGYDGNTTGAVTSSCITVTWADASCVLIEGGQITVSFIGPSSDNIATNAKDVNVFEFNLSAEENAEVRRLQYTLTATTEDADLDDDTGLLLDSDTANFTDIKLVDADTGETLCSPQDVTTGVAANDVTQTFTCTDSFYVDAGETRHLMITLDVANEADLENEEIKMTLEGISISEGIRSVDTGDYIADIVPSTDVTGNPQTIEVPTVTVTLASTPYSETVVKGSAGVEAVGFNFTAGDASDIRVTTVALQGYVDANVDGTFASDEESSVAISTIVQSISLYDEDGNEISTNDRTFDSTGAVTFSGLEWDITAGQTERLIVLVDIDNSVTPQGGTDDAFSIGITSASSVTAEDADGQSVTATASSVNGTTSPTTAITVTTTGLITVAASDDPVDDDKAVADADSSSDPLLVARYKIYSQSEDFRVEDLKFVNDSASNNSSEDNDAIDSVIIKYPTSLSAPDTLDGSSSISLVSGAASFTGLEIMVPKSESDENAIDIEVYVVTNSIDAGGIVPAGAQIELDFEEGSGFRAVGLGSGSVVTHDSGSSSFGTTADVDANQIALYKALPTFATHTSSSVCPSSVIVPATESSVYCFTVAASGSGQIQLYKMTFDATANLLETGTTTGQLANSNGWKLYEYSSSGSVDSTSVGSGTWSSSTNQATLTFDTSNSDSRVSAGSTKYYVLKAPVSLTSNTDTSSLSVRIAGETATSHAALAAAASVSGLNVWSDTSASSHSATTADWTHSYKLETLPSDYLQLSES